MIPRWRGTAVEWGGNFGSSERPLLIVFGQQNRGHGPVIIEPVLIGSDEAGRQGVPTKAVRRFVLDHFGNYLPAKSSQRNAVPKAKFTPSTKSGSGAVTRVQL